MKFFKALLIFLLILVILAGAAFGYLYFRIWYKGKVITPENKLTEEQYSELCVYENETGKAFIDSEIARLKSYAEDDFAYYFTDSNSEEVASYIEVNLHTLIDKLSDAGYCDIAIRRGQVIYLTYYLAQEGWNYRVIYSAEINHLKTLINPDGSLTSDIYLWQEQFKYYGVE